MRVAFLNWVTLDAVRASSVRLAALVTHAMRVADAFGSRVSLFVCSFGSDLACVRVRMCACACMCFCLSFLACVRFLLCGSGGAVVCSSCSFVVL